MSHANTNRLERHFSESSKSLTPIENDPVSARVEMALSTTGSEIADIVKAGSNTGAKTGGQIMEMLALMMARQPERHAGCHGPVKAQPENHASTVNAVSGGLDGLGRGLGGAIPSNRGNEIGNPAPKEIPASKPRLSLSNPQPSSRPKPNPASGSQAPKPDSTLERARVVKSYKLKELEPAKVEKMLTPATAPASTPPAPLACGQQTVPSSSSCGTTVTSPMAT